MVHIVDEGGQFDVPLATIWKFLQAPEDHSASHPEHRNLTAKPLGEGRMQVSWEQEAGGRTVKVVNHITLFPPVGMVIEMVEGPLAGSKFFNIYTPKGPQTGVTVVGEFQSPVMPENQVEPVVRENFDRVFAQDTAALKKFAQRR